MTATRRPRKHSTRTRRPGGGPLPRRWPPTVRGCGERGPRCAGGRRPGRHAGSGGPALQAFDVGDQHGSGEATTRRVVINLDPNRHRLFPEAAQGAENGRRGPDPGFEGNGAVVQSSASQPIPATTATPAHRRRRRQSSGGRPAPPAPRAARDRREARGSRRGGSRSRRAGPRARCRCRRRPARRTGPDRRVTATGEHDVGRARHRRPGLPGAPVLRGRLRPPRRRPTGPGQQAVDDPVTAGQVLDPGRVDHHHDRRRPAPS